MLDLPSPRAEVLDRRQQIARDLRALLGREAPHHISQRAQAMRPMVSPVTARAMLVVLAEDTAQVAAVLRYCHDNEVPVMARGAGTSLAGGALPQQDTVVLGLSKMNEILEVNAENQTARVQAGVTNRNISTAVDDLGLFYAPDPSARSPAPSAAMSP